MHPGGWHLGATPRSRLSAHRARLPSRSPGPPGASLTLQLLPEHGQEDGEVDGPGGLLHHGLQLLVLHVDAAWRRGGVGTPRSIMRDRGVPACRQFQESRAQDQGASYRVSQLSCPQALPTCPGTSGRATHSATVSSPSLPHSRHHLSLLRKENQLAIIPILQMKELRPKEGGAQVHRGRKTWASGLMGPGMRSTGGGGLGSPMVPADGHISRSSKFVQTGLGYALSPRPDPHPIHA